MDEAPFVNVDGQRVCNNCLEAPAILNCVDCKEDFCRDCSGKIHKGGKRAEHSLSIFEWPFTPRRVQNTPVDIGRYVWSAWNWLHSRSDQVMIEFDDTHLDLYPHAMIIYIFPLSYVYVFVYKVYVSIFITYQAFTSPQISPTPMCIHISSWMRIRHNLHDRP